jgi:hypothetical protein
MRELLVTMQESNEKIYIMYNKNTDATIECTQKYLMQWIARGFEVVEIRNEQSNIDNG